MTLMSTEKLKSLDVVDANGEKIGNAVRHPSLPF